MSSRAVVRRNSRAVRGPYTGRQRLAATVNAARLMAKWVRTGIRRRRQIQDGIRRATALAQRARAARHNRNRRIGPKKTVAISGMAHGPTFTTTRMIVRRTPRRQKFMRKLFKTNPTKTMYVDRFGYAWMGASDNNRTVWYSSTYLKFNNIAKYLKGRIIDSNETAGVQNTEDMLNVAGNSPDAYIYIGKCTFTYEIYNPTNYNITVWIYDLICKRDTPFDITYADEESDVSSAPENMMRKSTEIQQDRLQNPTWMIADPTVENTNTYWNSVGMKPTDYHYFNTFWKVKGMKKIVLAPTSAHHHIVVYNPKVKITQSSLYMPRQDKTADQKLGVAGITQSTLFGFQGQTAVEDGQETNTTNVGTLPGKIIVNVCKKLNVWSGALSTQQIVQTTHLKPSLQAPKIFTNLVEVTPTAV